MGEQQIIMKKWLKQHLENIIQTLHFVTDYLAITLALYISDWLWTKLSANSLLQESVLFKLPLYLTIGLLFVVVLRLTGAYNQRCYFSRGKSIKNVLSGLFWSYSLLTLICLIFSPTRLSPIRIISSFPLLLVAVGLERLILFHFDQLWLKKGIGLKRLLVYGTGKIGRRIARHFHSQPRLGYKFVGYIDDNPLKKTAFSEGDAEFQILGQIEQVKELTSQYQADEMFIAVPSPSIDHISQIIDKCNGSLSKYHFIAGNSDPNLRPLKLKSIKDIRYCSIKEYPTSSIKEFFKRLFDILFSACLLLPVAPIMALIALKIKQDSKGPVIFKQKRVGKNGKVFQMYKFRSMYVNTEPYAITPASNTDPRITPFGRFLRRTSLDELPQFINVLAGDMSVVGPRPEMEFIVKQYNAVQSQRLKVKPGITGLWQISLDRSKPIHEVIEHDLYYIENQSLWLDLKIIWDTAIFCIAGIFNKLKS